MNEPRRILLPAAPLHDVNCHTNHHGYCRVSEERLDKLLAVAEAARAVRDRYVYLEGWEPLSDQVEALMQSMEALDDD